MDAANVILGCVISEKSALLAEERVYTLRVALNATKQDIRQALKTLFNVDAVSVNTCIVRGKTVRRASSKKAMPIYVKKPNFKKAYVRLKEGQELPFYTNAMSKSDA